MAPWEDPPERFRDLPGIPYPYMNVSGSWAQLQSLALLHGCDTSRGSHPLRHPGQGLPLLQL